MSRNKGNSRNQSGEKSSSQGMYYVRPAFELPEPFPEVSTNMYSLKRQAPICILNGNECSNEVTDEQGRFRVQEKRYISSNFQNTSESKVEEIEARQQVMLDKLTHLKDMIQSIHTKYLNESEEQNATTVGRSSSVDLPDHLDIVINADPRRPPYSLLFIYKVLCQHFGSIKFQTHFHSSMMSKPEKYLNIFNYLQEQFHPDAKEKLSITLIWKDMNLDIELMVDPFNQIPIRGESNLARFLSRLLPTNSSLNYDTIEWGTLVKIDGLLELASQDEPLSLTMIEHQLLNQQRNGPFLFNEVTIADFVLFSSMAHQCASNPNKFNNNPCILRWLKDCQKYGDFELFLFY